MGRAGFWHRGFPRLTLHCVARELDIPQNKVTSFWNLVPSSGRIQFAATARIMSQVLSPWLDPLQIYHPHRPPTFTTERRVGRPRQMSLLL